MASCSKRQAYMNASLTAARSFPLLIKRGANRVEITKRRKELQRARQQAFALKQLQQPLGAGLEEALAHRWHHDRAGIDQQLCARPAGEPLFSLRVACVAIGAGGESQQTAVIVVVSPGKQRRVFSQQSLQAFDVVVVNDASEGLERRKRRERLRSGHGDGGNVPLPRVGGALSARFRQYRGTAVSMSTRRGRAAKRRAA